MSVESKRRLLLVDDDDDLRPSLALILRKDGYEVEEAQDGQAAKDLFDRGRFDTIISDIRMPNVTGLELLEHIKKGKPTPFILMTGFSDILETQQAYELGATEFLSKPFRKEELLAVLDLVLNRDTDDGPPESSFHGNVDADYCRLSIEEFVSGTRALADVFIRLSSQKYIRVAKKDSELSLERINTYKSKGLNYLYIRKEDFAKYVGFNMSLTRAVANKPKVSKAQKLRLLKHTTESLLQDTFVNGVDKEKLDDGRFLIESTVSILSEDSDLEEMLSMLQTHSNHTYAHSLGVSLYGTLMAKELGWTATPTLFKISMAGLLHDIGKKELPPEIMDKPRMAMTAQEREMYETHPIRGKEILASVPTIPNDILQIVLHHHENVVGRGFPFRLMKTRIHPLARLVAVANEFCNIALKSPWNPESIDGKEAVERLYLLGAQELDPVYIKALMLLFDCKLPKELERIQFKSA